jgi:dUTPase
MRLRESIELIKLTTVIEKDYQKKLLKILEEEQKRTKLGFIQYNRIIELFKDV